MIEIREVGQKENEQLLDLLSRCPRGTSLVVRQERHGDFFRRSSDMKNYQAFAAWDGKQIVGSLECSIRSVQMEGIPYQGGYLSGLSVDPDYRRLGIAGMLLEACEAYLQDRGADFGYCTVMEGNFPSMGLLGRHGYVERAQIQQMTLLSLRNKVPDPSVRNMIEDDLPEVAAILNRTYRSYDLFEPYTAASLAEHLSSLPELSLDDVFVYEQHGEIAACLGCWPVSDIVSSVVLRWDRRLEILTRTADFLKRWLPLPHIPKIGEAYRHCAIYPLGFRHSARDLSPLWPAVHARMMAQQRGSLTISMTKAGGIPLLREAGYPIRSGDSRILMKSFGKQVFGSNAPVYLAPLE